MVAKNEVILVPDNIKFESRCGDWDNLGIIFNKSKQVLYFWTEKWGSYRVNDHSKSDAIKCKLIKVNPEDRIIGYTYFRSDDLEKINDLAFYCKYLWNHKIAYTYNWEINLLSLYHNERHQVLPV